MEHRREVYLHFGNDAINLSHKGEINIEKGIYIASPGRFNGRHVELRDPIYIGKADRSSFKERIDDHAQKHHAEWERNYCRPGEEIYYQVAELKSGIADVEAAMIFTHKLPCNTDGVDNYLGSRPAPNVDYDVALPPVDGQLVDMQDINKKINGYSRRD